MPFTLQPKARAASTGRGCRAVVAARLLFPGSEFRVLRALQLANFTTELLLDDDGQIRDALAELPESTPARSSIISTRTRPWKRTSSTRRRRGAPRNGNRSTREIIDHRSRSRPLHGAVGGLRREWTAIRRGRLATRAGLRPVCREPRPHPRADLPPDDASALLERFPDGSQPRRLPRCSLLAPTTSRTTPLQSSRC